MKLLYCKECGDIFNLKFAEKTCGCGKTRGQYVTNRKAIAQGPAVAIGMGSGSLHQALEQAQEMDSWNEGHKHDRKAYQNDCQILTWARPMTGPGNPNTLTYETWEKMNPTKTVNIVEFSQQKHKEKGGQDD